MPLIYYMEGHKLHFGCREFSLITDFRFGTVSFDLHISCELKFWNRVFPNKIGFSITNLDIIGVIKDEEIFCKLSDDDAIRLCLLLALEVIFMRRLLTINVDDTLFSLVENIEAWSSFPWGEHLWCHLYDEIKNLKERHSNEHYYGLFKGRNYVSTYTLSGFVFAFQESRAPPIKEHHGRFETYLSKLEKARKHGKTCFMVSSIRGTTDNSVLSHERSDRQAKLKFTNEFSSMTSDLCDSLNSMFADLIEPADPDEDIGHVMQTEQIKCKFPWKDDYIVDRNFWLKLVCLDPARKGWLTEEHIDLWGDYMWHVRPENSNWAMVSFYFVQLLFQNGMPLFYANRERYTTTWSEVDQVQLPVVLERAIFFQKNEIDPSKYTITFRLADNVPTQGAYLVIVAHGDIQSKVTSHEKLKSYGKLALMKFDESRSWEKEQLVSPLLRTPPLKKRRKVIAFQGKNLYADFLHADCVDDHFDVLDNWSYEDVYGGGLFNVSGSFKVFDCIEEPVGCDDGSLPIKIKDEFENEVILDDVVSSPTNFSILLKRKGKSRVRFTRMRGIIKSSKMVSLRMRVRSNN
uniref:Phospholipase-like protein n=1 Tax=Tanacetum cinerariifolium TaxID=118510 RepID=A0A6L2KC61_TANCI|nr:phospholipase-like protein [Tanacetum cinerariifolium]